jgi:TonB family protein
MSRYPALASLGAAFAAFALASAPARAQEPVPGATESQEQPPRIESTNPACQPVYPAASLKAGVTGTTAVRFAITAAGQITRAEVVRVSGPTLEHRLLDYAFEQALATCPYFPGRDWQGRAVGGTITATHVWQLPATAEH